MKANRRQATPHRATPLSALHRALPVLLLLGVAGCSGDPTGPGRQCEARIQDARWTHPGPEGAVVRDVIETPEGLFAGTATRGVMLRSAPGGGWASLGLEERAVEALLYQPEPSARLFAGLNNTDSLGSVCCGKPGLFAREFPGGGWTARDTGLVEPDGSNNEVRAIAQRPDDPTILFIAGPFQGAASSDGGENWRLLPLAGAEDIMFSRGDPLKGWIWSHAAFGGEDILCRTTDGGMIWVSWECWNVPFQMTSLSLGPGTEDELWVGGIYRIHRSTDGGESWTTLLEIEATAEASADSLPKFESLVLEDPLILAFGLADLDREGDPGGTEDPSALRVFASCTAGETWTEVPVPASAGGALSATPLDGPGMSYAVGTRETGVWTVEF